MAMAKVFLIGNVGRDPELKMTANGKPVCEFSVAINRGSKDDKQETDWYRVSMWGRQAEAAQQYVTKGQLLFVEGRFRPRLWTTREGEQRLSLEVDGDNFQLLGGKREEREPAGVGATAAPPAPATLDPDEIPF